MYLKHFVSLTVIYVRYKNLFANNKKSKKRQGFLRRLSRRRKKDLAAIDKVFENSSGDRVLFLYKNA